MKYQHVCPRNCYSSCTMISHVENNKITLLTGDPNHPYTKGKLCAKGHAHIERNNHPKRLKYPYYRPNKRGAFSPISWERAYQLIVQNMMDLYKKHKNFLPLALYKNSGNLGMLQYATEEFFSSLGATSRIIGHPGVAAGIEALHYQTGGLKMSDPTEISNSDLIIIWGSNPTETNIHLIPFIYEAMGRGGKLVVIDPLYTKTAELADLYIQLRPSTDGALANLLVQYTVDQGACNNDFLTNYSVGFDEFLKELRRQDREKSLEICDISPQAFDHLAQLLKEATVVSHLIGPGLQRHSNGGQNIRAIEALAACRGDLGKRGGGIYYGHAQGGIFNRQQIYKEQGRKLNMNKWIKDPRLEEGDIPIEFLWITCGNPLVQNPNPQYIRSHLMKIPFVVTVDDFMTATAKASNLVLPTTSIFEQVDIVTNNWHKEIAFNEKAIKPYFESQSEWKIMTDMAQRLNEIKPNCSTFPIYENEEEYLKHLFNEKLCDQYRVNSLQELKNLGMSSKKNKELAWKNWSFLTESGKYQFYSSEAEINGHPPTPIYVSGKLPDQMFPFWLISPHHPYTINSQFHFTSLIEEKDPFVNIHEAVANRLSIQDGEMIRLFNNQGSIITKAISSKLVPKDTLMIYSGGNLLNQLIPVIETDMGENVLGANGIAYYDTFVNISKL